MFIPQLPVKVTPVSVLSKTISLFWYPTGRKGDNRSSGVKREVGEVIEKIKVAVIFVHLQEVAAPL